MLFESITVSQGMYGVNVDERRRRRRRRRRREWSKWREMIGMDYGGGIAEGNGGRAESRETDKCVRDFNVSYFGNPQVRWKIKQILRYLFVVETELCFSYSFGRVNPISLPMELIPSH
ncbi:hypothetical protein CDL15_Pgr013596 [Punica granatum]|uniref:Uncharacterized protein n=1 Tax=Punica granatum TaxID=22663 RepID=A0A218W1I6_PUNGR|nr:hypothetical protein CDL15_Pgr013596 [Punica granatum]